MGSRHRRIFGLCRGGGSEFRGGSVVGKDAQHEQVAVVPGLV